MITEDYVSFETALLLKKKGFEQIGCQKQYNTQGDLCTGYCYGPVAPTLQMAMKWLREEYKIYIDINISIILEQWSGYNVSIYKTNTNDGLLDTIIYRKKLKDNTSFEEAAKVAIKYCLEKII